METKMCTICGIEKDLSEFYKNKSKKDKHDYKCKQCTCIVVKEFKRGQKGMVTYIYRAQIEKSKKRNHPEPSYTLKEFRVWMHLQPNFEELYNNWVKSEYNKWLKPSCDRLDDYKPYSLDNIRLVTWSENNLKGYEDRKNGINNKQSKAVIQYDLQGNYIKEFYSISQASRELNIYIPNISNACNNDDVLASCGYIWKFKQQ